jgi:DNA-binding sugar fermentation-stimulating protein
LHLNSRSNIPFISLTLSCIVDVEGQKNGVDEHIADAGRLNGCQNEGDDHIQTELNQDEHTQNDATMNEVNENDQTHGGMDSAGLFL